MASLSATQRESSATLPRAPEASWGGSSPGLLTNSSAPPSNGTADPCNDGSVDGVGDQFEAQEFNGTGWTTVSAAGGWPVVTWATFQRFWTSADDQPGGTYEDHAIADTTAQRTTKTAYGRRSPFGPVTTYPAGSIRLYVNARTPAGGYHDVSVVVDGVPTTVSQELGSEYSLLSVDGINFEMEMDSAFASRPQLRLDAGQGQAESYMADDGTLWMYYAYNANLPASPGPDVGPDIGARTSTDGVSFAAGVTTQLGANRTDTGDTALLTGLSVVNTGVTTHAVYRGYFGDEGPVATGNVFAARSTNLQAWTLQNNFGFPTVGPHGEVIGPNSLSDIRGMCRQPFALKRNDPSSPGCVTLFYYRTTPPPEDASSEVWYSTSLDGVTFYKERKLDLGGGSPNPHNTMVAGPTLLDSLTTSAGLPVYFLYTDSADAGSTTNPTGNHITQVHQVSKV